MDRWTAARITDQSGRTFIVTGANSGLGFETTRQLAARGGRVILAARSEARGQEAVARLTAAQPGAAVEFRPLDLAYLDSVRAFAAAILPQSDGSSTIGVKKSVVSTSARSGSRWTYWSTMPG